MHSGSFLVFWQKCWSILQNLTGASTCSGMAARQNFSSKGPTHGFWRHSRPTRQMHNKIMLTLYPLTGGIMSHLLSVDQQRHTVDLCLQVGDRSSTTSLCVLYSLYSLARACCALALHWVCIKCCFLCGTRKAAIARLSCDHLVRLQLFVALLEQLSVPLQPNAWGQKPTSNPQATLAGCEPQRAPSRAVLQANWQQDWQKSDLCKQVDQAC